MTARRMRVWRYLPLLTGLVGLAGAIVLFVRHHPLRILRLVALAGFGMLWLVPLRLVTMALNAEGWRVLFPQRQRPSRRLLTWLAFVRNAINTLLPVAHVGGEVAAARDLIRRGVGADLAVSGIVVETTVTLFVQMGFTVIGIGLLLSYGGGNVLVTRLWWGLAVAVSAGLLFVFVQRRGRVFARLQRAFVRLAAPWGASVADGATVEAAIVRA